MVSSRGMLKTVGVRPRVVAEEAEWTHSRDSGNMSKAWLNRNSEGHPYRWVL